MKYWRILESVYFLYLQHNAFLNTSPKSAPFLSWEGLNMYPVFMEHILFEKCCFSQNTCIFLKKKKIYLKNCLDKRKDGKDQNQ